MVVWEEDVEEAVVVMEAIIENTDKYTRFFVFQIVTKNQHEKL